LRAVERLRDLGPDFLIDLVQLVLRLGELCLKIFQFLVQVVGFLLQGLAPVRIRRLADVLDGDVVKAGLGVEIGLDAAIVVVREIVPGHQLAFRRTQLVVLGVVILLGLGDLFARLRDLLLAGKLRNHLVLVHRFFHVAEVALNMLELAIVILPEHPQGSQQHQDAGNREDDVERPLIAVGLIGGGHDRPSISINHETHEKHEKKTRRKNDRG
jgi:hypothetical protein